MYNYWYIVPHLLITEPTSLKSRESLLLLSLKSNNSISIVVVDPSVLNTEEGTK